MKKHITFLILLLGFLSHGQDKPIVIYQEAPDRQKITEFEKRNDSLVISLENSGTNKVYLGDLRTDVSGKANINSPTFTGNVIVPTATISDAAVNLGQMMDSLATVGTGLIQEIASTKTLTKEDAWIVYRNRSITSEEFTYTIQNQTNGGFTEDIGYTFYTKDNGKIFVKGETGSGVEPVEISGAGQYETIIRVGENSWDWSKGVLPWNWNLYNLANSANPDNEVNATTGITGVTDWMPTSVSSNPAPHSGSYSIKLVHGEGTSPEKRSDITLSGLTIGKSYKVGIWVIKLSTTGDGPMAIDMGASGDRGWATSGTLAAINSSVPQNEWTYFEAIGEATKTNPVITVRTSTSAGINASLAYDTITVEEMP